MNLFYKQRKANKEMKLSLIKSRIELQNILVNTLIKLTPLEKLKINAKNWLGWISHYRRRVAMDKVDIKRNRGIING